MRARKILRTLDYTLLVTAILIVLYGLVAISSATHVTNPAATDPFLFMKRQALWALIGFTAAGLLVCWRYEELPRYATALYIVNLALLAAVLFVGHTALGAQRWIRLGPFLLQPSEFAKLIIIVTLANFLARREGKLRSFRELVPVFLYVGLPLLLILKQPDLGTSLVFIAITFAMLYMAGARTSVLAFLGSAGLLGSGAWIWAHLKFGVWLPLKEYQVTRLTIFLNPWQDWQGAGYHMIQSQIALGSGGLLGRGLYNGTQNQLNFLPEQHTDFIFSVVGEELGFVGAAALLLLYFVLIFRGIKIAAAAKDTFGRLLATGIVTMLLFHILVNVGMTMGIMPVTGIPLPLFSYGGSALLTNLAAIGLLENIYVRRQQIIF
ncbi:rod shape determining protein RodA [Thermodesulfitimonas autotrophica]|uniref:Peptidoglycan glycosyltransferase RodA n=1 Tax=Thermodesulfitimonas autotrophica TaxID=1894989 RepID=A0A3N5BU11_9THEO|nr:rod shape-determining protein RodA [Thermodesulfitimonas autotrophica]RPF49365.1 rod shape determining protein RodA [Thermodesulfitimonas autotrophica]